MKKLICLLMAACMVLSLGACGSKSTEKEPEEPQEPQETQTVEWSREGFFEDGNGNYLSVTWMEFDDVAGWYVAYQIGEESYGNFLEQEGNSLHGNIVPEFEEGEIIVTVSEEGEDGLVFSKEGGETYHFTPTELDEATFTVSIDTDGIGQIAYAKEGEEELSFDKYYTSSQLGLNEPETYVFGANTDEEGWEFVKWTKNGQDYATDPIITVELTENSDFIAVFEYVGTEQNP